MRRIDASLAEICRARLLQLRAGGRPFCQPNRARLTSVATPATPATASVPRGVATEEVGGCSDPRQRKFAKARARLAENRLLAASPSRQSIDRVRGQLPPAGVSAHWSADVGQVNWGLTACHRTKAARLRDDNLQLRSLGASSWLFAVSLIAKYLESYWHVTPS